MTPTPPADPRKPKCSRCRHHGIVIPKKGHAKLCPFLSCSCWKCGLVTQRARVAAVQRNLGRSPGTTEQRPGPAAGGPGGGAGALDTSGQGSSGGTPESALWSPVELQSPRPDPGGDPGSGLEGRDDPRGASDSPYPGELGPAFPHPLPRPLPHCSFPMWGPFPGSYPPHFLLHLQHLPPVPAGLYDGLHGPLLLPPVQQGVLQFLPPTEATPPADCGAVFVTLQPPPLPPESSSGAAASDSSGHEL